MRWRILALAFVAYVGMDFGNPMVPGAVQFVEGALETVEGSYGRGADALDLVAPNLGASANVPAWEPRHVVPPVACPTPLARRRPILARRPLSPPGDPAPSPDDH